MGARDKKETREKYEAARKARRQEQGAYLALSKVMKELRPDSKGLRSLDFDRGRMGQWLNTVEQVAEMLQSKGFQYETFLKRSGYRET